MELDQNVYIQCMLSDCLVVFSTAVEQTTICYLLPADFVILARVVAGPSIPCWV